jgi:hypothetical protein
MNRDTDLPLNLFQVLEEEYQYLYGPLPAMPQRVYLPDKESDRPPASPPPASPPAGDSARADSPSGGPGEGDASAASDGPPAEGPPADGCWRRVEAECGWLFLPGHIEDPVRLAAALIPHEHEERNALPPDLKQTLATPEWSRENLKRYIYDIITRGTDDKPGRPDLLPKLIALHAGGKKREPPRELVGQLEDELNYLLHDAKLYHPDHFAGAWVGHAARNLIALRNTIRGRKVGVALRQRRLRAALRIGRRGEETAENFRHEDDLLQFNRILLEDAFPELERISDVRLAAVFRLLHRAGPTALSLSGGGIRSGTFALGLLQGFARHDLLKSFDYLSTVSGGGYIGGWLSAWLHRHPEGLQGVTRELANCPPASRIDPDPAPLQHLRRFSNFITPKVGLMTADTWTFVGIYLRNLLINWMVFIPLLAAVLLIPRLLLAVTLMQPTGFEPASGGFVDQVTNFALANGRHVLLLAGSLLGVWAFGYVDFNRPGLRTRLQERSRFWRHRGDQRHFIKWCLAPLVGSAALLTTYFAWSSEYYAAAKGFWPLLFFGLAFILGGGVVSSLVLRRHEPALERLAGARRVAAVRRRAPPLGVLLFGYERPAPAGGAPPPPPPKKTLNRFWIGAALLLAGALAGLIFFGISRGTFGTPVINYKPQPGQEPFDFLIYGDWWRWTSELYVCAAVPAFLLVFWGATTFFVGVSSASSAVSDEDREWWSRLGAWLIIAAMAWAAGSALVIYGPVVLLSSPKLMAAVGGLSGLAALLLGRSSKTPGHAERKSEQTKGGSIMAKLLPLLALVFLAALLAALSLVTSYLLPALALALAGTFERIAALPVPLLPGRAWLPADAAEWLTNAHAFADYVRYVSPPPPPGDTYAAYTRAKLVHMSALHHTSFWFTSGFGLLLALWGYVLSHFVNLNIFSLHGGYRNRLIRAFPGASRPEGERRPNPFTGFDPEDNVPMHALRPGLLDEDDLLDAPGLRNRLLAERPSAPPDAHARLAALLEPYLKRTPDAPDAEVAELRDALRTDLNRALVELSLYVEFDPDFVDTRRARDIVDNVKRAHGAGRLGRDAVRTDYHILLNRLVLERAYENLIKPAPYPPPPYKLLHVVNTALNLVGGDNLAWQQRKAEPFSVSPLHSGCFRLGYRASRDYGGRDTGGISLGTAAAISGAAASSNMGYYTTSPVISLLLTLFNVRLGWWLGNPGPAGHDTYSDRAPRSSVMPVLYEAFGMTDDKNPYVYLTDGGHFENLALYEMVLRRCRVIVCADGAQDADYRFGDLGNAVRKIRIDLGVPIEFTSVPIYAAEPDPKEGKGRGFYWAVGKIRYGCVDRGEEDGVIIYVKPAVYGEEPRDILEYKKSFPAFPHQSTGDQFFDEPQFESYRALGSHVIDQMCGAEPGKVNNIYNLVERAFEKLSGGQPPADTGIRKWLPRWLNRYDPTSPPREES